MSTVKIWEEDTLIPTYKVYPPEKNPLFIEKRAYQGSTGKVYPLPVTEKISDTKEDISYHAVYLENEYLKLMILPELGGRIQRALDKTNNYDFVYYNHVIKPALGALGLQDKEKAGLLLEEILEKQPDYLEAILLMKRL